MDTFNCAERDNSGRKRLIPIHVLESPLCLILNCRKFVCLQGIEELIFFAGVLYVCVNQKAVGFRVHSLHEFLTRVKGTSFRKLDFSRKIYAQVFVHDSV